MGAETSETTGGAEAQAAQAEETRATTEQAQSDQAPDLSGKVSTLEGRIKELKAELKAERAGRAEDRAIFGTGFVDPEGIEAARWQHSRLPEDERPPIAEWIKGMMEDPSKRPKALQGFFAQAKAETESTASSGDDQEADAGTKPAGRTMGAERGSGDGTGPSSGSKLSAEGAKARLVQLAAAATKSGDWSTYDEERPALLQRISEG